MLTNFLAQNLADGRSRIRGLPCIVDMFLLVEPSLGPVQTAISENVVLHHGATGLPSRLKRRLNRRSPGICILRASAR
jgi:hypothetical protein